MKLELLWIRGISSLRDLSQLSNCAYIINWCVCSSDFFKKENSSAFPLSFPLVYSGCTFENSPNASLFSSAIALYCLPFLPFLPLVVVMVCWMMKLIMMPCWTSSCALFCQHWCYWRGCLSLLKWLFTLSTEVGG